MIFICLLKLKIGLPQLINELLVDLIAVNIFILPAIGRVFYAIWDLHKAYILCGIAYNITAIVYILVLNIFLKVHIII